MGLADRYEVRMVSLKNKSDGGSNVFFGNGANLQPWHLDVLEAWLKGQRAKAIDGSDLV